MAQLGKVVYLSEAQKATLFSTGTVTSNGTTITYSPNDLYVTPDISSVPMVGATTTTNGASGLVPAPSTNDVDKFLSGDGTYKSGGLPMVILSYGNSTWNDFITAYRNNVIVYCRASSNTNPATGTQGRMAFMAYTNSDTNPTEVEFQYYRSMNSHSASLLCDEVYVYKLTSGGTWTVTTRQAGLQQITTGNTSNLGATWSSNVLTLTGGLPAVTSADNGKILKVVDGAWALVDP